MLGCLESRTSVPEGTEDWDFGVMGAVSTKD